MTTEEFIIQHRRDAVADLALHASRWPGVDMPFALEQIDGWQRACRKLPTWAATEGIVYPPHLAMEQCSSEQTGEGHLEAAARWRLIRGPYGRSGRGFLLCGSIAHAGEFRLRRAPKTTL